MNVRDQTNSRVTFPAGAAGRQMICQIFLLLMPVFGSLFAQSSDTLTARVCRWNSLETKKDVNHEWKEILEGSTPDLAKLEIHASVLEPGRSPDPPHLHADMEELIIVKEGLLKVTVNGVSVAMAAVTDAPCPGRRIADVSHFATFFPILVQKMELI